MMYKYQEVGNLGGRFVSEFGMEAYPHMSTVRQMASDPSQLYPGSMVLDFHNKAINHERRLMTYIVENFRPKHDVESYAHLSQVVQADTMRAAYKTWRRQWGKPKARQCGGVLVWQLNDCWPTMSWAVVDYFLIKKPAYYAIARAMRKIDVGVSRTYHDWTSTGYYIDENSSLVTGQVDQTLPARKGKYDVWIPSSSVKPVGVEVTVRFISVKSGSEIAASVTTKATAAPNSTTDVIIDEPYPTSIPDAADVTEPFPVAQYDPYVIYVTVSVDGTVVSSDTAWPDPVKFLDLSGRGVSFEISSAKDSVVVTARKPVKGFVFEEMQGLKLSDNGFDVIPGVRHAVKVEGKLTADKLRFTYVGAPEGSMGIPN
jgi:beta-mannosidase